MPYEFISEYSIINLPHEQAAASKTFISISANVTVCIFSKKKFYPSIGVGKARLNSLDCSSVRRGKNECPRF
jgi:hypothetical protein